jgi:hypothetical protein
MTRKEDSDKVSKRLNQHIRQAHHSREYYLSLFILAFGIPLYVLLQIFYVYAGGWQLHDLLFILALFAVAVYGLYKESASRTKLPIWFIVLGVISGVAITIVIAFIK